MQPTKLNQFLLSANPEQTLFDHLRALSAPPVPPGDPDRLPMRILLAGHVGAGNVGSEIRTAEAVRQIAFLLGADTVQFTALLNGPFRSAADVTLAPLEGYLPEVLAELVDRHDAVLACEGSMLKSSFSNVLSGLMAGALSRAAAAAKPAIGYGAEIGTMEPILERFVSDTLTAPLFLCRNKTSLERAHTLGLRAAPGADPAWIVEPSPDADAQALLRTLGIPDRVLVICPTNPFWWPVRPNPALDAQAQTEPSLQALRFSGVFFHTYDAPRRLAFERYADAFAMAATRICHDCDLHPLLVAMDPTDSGACEAIQRRLGGTTRSCTATRIRSGWSSPLCGAPAS